MALFLVVMVLNTAICDDEKLYIDNIVQHLNYFSRDNNVNFEKSIFTNAEDMLSSNIKFDIAILDVEMNGMNGLKLGEQLRKINSHIVLMYVTAHRKYLDDALNLNAVRFFEKPLDSQRFYRGLRDAIKRIDNSTINFYLKDGKTTERVSAQDIIFVEIEKRRTKLVTIDGEYRSSNNINFWKENLSSSIFISPHKSFVVNLNYVTTYKRNLIILDGQYDVPISRNKQTDFRKVFMRFVEGK